MFVQIIEGKTSNPDGLRERGEAWERELGPGAVGVLGVTAGATADGKAITIVRFESEEAAKQNADRPEQGAWFAETAKLYDEGPTFTESSDITEWLGGGSNDAGFVQVMKSTGVDRAAVESMDAEFAKFVDQRPDLLGGLRIWTGSDSCYDVAYFTSEAEARASEKAGMPDELRSKLEGFGAALGQTEYLDITEPHLR